MRFSDFPFLRYLPFFIAGILFHSFIPISWIRAFVVLGVLWGSYWILLIKNRTGPTSIHSSLAYAMLLVLGIGIADFQVELKNNNEGLSESQAYLARALRYDVPKPNSKENLLEVIAYHDSLGWERSGGKVILYHQADLFPGQVIFLSQGPEKIDPPTFPNEFDYQSFLARKGIQFRQFIRKPQVIDMVEDRNSIEFGVLYFRKYLIQILEKYLEIPESRQIASALILGEKDGLDREVRKAYSETGTMHILAVSGLHVGIIYAILLFPLKRVNPKSKYRKLYLLGVVVLIWVYAGLTGFSPSVIRASGMFTLFSLGQMRERKPSIWNILAFSAMLMIAVNPEVMMDVGFQLSYTAVAGIVGLQPLIVRWWQPQSRILEYFWQLAAVSLAAQLATFPLTLYYFHIFPTYFLLANLVIIPMAFVSMILGLGLLVFSWIPGFGWLLGNCLDYWIWVQNLLNSIFQNLPGSVLEKMTISGAGMLTVWGILWIWGNWEWGNRRRLVYYGLFLVLVWRVDALVKEISRPAEEIQIFSKNEKVLIQSRIGSQTLVWNQDFPTDQITFSLDPFRIQNEIPLVPDNLQGIKRGDQVYFPGLGFEYSISKKDIILKQGSQFLVKKYGE